MDTSNTTPRRRTTWLENDVYGRWGKLYVRIRPETRAWTKRWTHKRERREAQALIHEQLQTMNTD